MIRGILLVSASLTALGLASSACAQAVDDPASATLAADTSEGAAGDETIVVTGTRLRGTFTAPTPVTSVDSDLLERRAVTSAGEILAELPGFRQTVGPTQAQRQLFNGGQTSPDLRGLGVTRTLTLVNGRRWMPSNFNGTIDTSLLPSNLVDRVDVVTGGASAAYGSDAVAGVVNYILRDRMEGVTGSMQYGLSEQGDNKEFAASLAAGVNFADDRAHLIVAGDYADNKGAGTLYSRDWSKGAAILAYGAGRPAGTPSQVLAPNVLYSNMTNGSVILSGPLAGTAFGPDGQPFAFSRGTTVGTFMSGGVNPQGYPLGQFPLRTPTKRYSLFGRLTYDVTPDLKVYAEGSHGRNSGTGFAGFNTTTTNFIVDISNPYIPPATRAAMLANGLTTINVGRFNTETDGNQQDNAFSTTRFSAGIEGKIFADWDIDAYYSRGRSRSQNRIPTNYVTANQLAAYYVVADANGNPVCGPIATNPNLTPAQRALVQPGCVPFNIFGANRASDAAIDYVTDAQIQDVHLKQDVIAANISGSPFSTWAGPVSVATGFEHRTFNVVQETDRLSQLTAFAFGNPKPFRGSQSVTEGYLELGVPLLRDSALGKALDLNAALRRTHYNTSGSVTTWKVGGVYDLNDSIRLRLTRSRDVRAPSPFELFSGGGGFIASTVGVINPFNSQTGALRSTVVVNPDLKPERADTISAGIVLQPQWSWARSFQASIDYYDIKINGVVATPLARDVLSGCYAGSAAYCSYIRFDNSAFGIDLVSIPLLNLNSQRTRGVDAEISYRVPDFGIPGRIDLRAVGTWVAELRTTDRARSIDRAGWGVGGVPRFTSTADVNYTLGRFNAGLQWRHISSVGYDPTLIGPDNPAYSPSLPNSISVNRFPAADYFNLSLRYTLRESGRQRVQLFGVINNLLDKDPPFGATQLLVTGNPYDVIGRTFRFGVRASM